MSLENSLGTNQSIIKMGYAGSFHQDNNLADKFHFNILIEFCLILKLQPWTQRGDSLCRHRLVYLHYYNIIQYICSDDQQVQQIALFFFFFFTRDRTEEENSEVQTHSFLSSFKVIKCRNYIMPKQIFSWNISLFFFTTQLLCITYNIWI